MPACIVCILLASQRFVVFLVCMLVLLHAMEATLVEPLLYKYFMCSYIPVILC